MFQLKLKENRYYILRNGSVIKITSIDEKDKESEYPVHADNEEDYTLDGKYLDDPEAASEFDIVSEAFVIPIESKPLEKEDHALLKLLMLVPNSFKIGIFNDLLFNNENVLELSFSPNHEHESVTE